MSALRVQRTGSGPGAQTRRLWRTGIAAPWHVESSQTKDRTRVPCTGRRLLQLGASREGPVKHRGPSSLHPVPLALRARPVHQQRGLILCGLSLHTRVLPRPRASSMVCSLLVAKLEKPRNTESSPGTSFFTSRVLEVGLLGLSPGKRSQVYTTDVCRMKVFSCPSWL